MVGSHALDFITDIGSLSLAAHDDAVLGFERQTASREYACTTYLGPFEMLQVDGLSTFAGSLHSGHVDHVL